MKLAYKIILWIIGLSCFIVLYHLFDPTHSQWAPKCPFWLLTGYSCPGCGSQRAIHCFLNGRIWEGIQYNYILVPSLLYVMMITLSPKEGKLHKAITGSTACWIVLTVFLAWWLLRNLLGI